VTIFFSLINCEFSQFFFFYFSLIISMKTMLRLMIRTMMKQKTSMKRFTLLKQIIPAKKRTGSWYVFDFDVCMCIFSWKLIHGEKY